MTVIRPNSISGINSITAQVSALNFYDSAGAALPVTAGAINVDNINATGVSTFANATIAGGSITGVSTIGVTTITATTLTVNGNAYPSAGPLSNRNKIINGDMRIDQRNAGASVTLSSDLFIVDRFYARTQSATDSTAQRSTTAPSGFTNSLLITIGTGASPASSATNAIRQEIEGFNIADLGWGTASAKTVTLSFWVRSSLTGTFGGALSNGDLNRAYPYTYTISVADTWEYKTVTIEGDTSGTWATDNSSGIRFWVDLGSGTDKQGTAGAWAASDYRAASGCTQLVATTGATLNITGVQLEAGSVATPFERRSYGDELARCQRYYYRLYADSGRTFAVGYNQNTTATRNIIHFPVTMRSAPTALEQTGTASNYRVLIGATVISCSAVPTLNSTTTNTGEVQATVSSGLTAGQGNCLESNANGTYLGFTAEL